MECQAGLAGDHFAGLPRRPRAPELLRERSRPAVVEAQASIAVRHGEERAVPARQHAWSAPLVHPALPRRLEATLELARLAVPELERAAVVAHVHPRCAG